jgi:serine/threonine protein kinase
MCETVTALHELYFLIHSDLHQKNWLLDKQNNLVLCDFGCAKYLGKGGKIPIGTKVFYADIHSPPEMQYQKGQSFFNATTQEEFDFKGDVFQVGFAMQCMLVQGEWIM